MNRKRRGCVDQILELGMELMIDRQMGSVAYIHAPFMGIIFPEPQFLRMVMGWHVQLHGLELLPYSLQVLKNEGEEGKQNEVNS